MDYIKYIREKVGHDCIFINCVAACIYNKRGEILLQKRSDRNKWGFPGGVMELGESVEEALKREVKEETGLCVDINGFIGVYSKYYDKYPNNDEAQPIVLLFECKIMGGNLDTSDDETLDLKYFNESNIPELVNKQHNDMMNDVLSDRENFVIR